MQRPRPAPDTACCRGASSRPVARCPLLAGGDHGQHGVVTPKVLQPTLPEQLPLGGGERGGQAEVGDKDAMTTVTVGPAPGARFAKVGHDAEDSLPSRSRLTCTPLMTRPGRSASINQNTSCNPNLTRYPPRRRDQFFLMLIVAPSHPDCRATQVVPPADFAAL